MSQGKIGKGSATRLSEVKIGKLLYDEYYKKARKS